MSLRQSLSLAHHLLVGRCQDLAALLLDSFCFSGNVIAI